MSYEDNVLCALVRRSVIDLESIPSKAPIASSMIAPYIYTMYSTYRPDWVEFISPADWCDGQDCVTVT